MAYFKRKNNISKLVVKRDTNPNPNQWVEATEEEFDAWKVSQQKRREILKLKRELAATDYQAIKHSEGWISNADYAPIKAERQAKRDRINELEEELK